MQRGLARLLAAEAVSNFGAMLSRVAIPWIAALALDASPFAMAFLVIADVVAGALGSLVLGAWVDRADKRAVMLGTDVARAVVLGWLAAAAFGRWISMPLLVAAAAASGILTVMFELARSAWMAQRIAAGDLAQGNSRMSMATSLSETLAFALGGWLYQAAGAVVALAIDAASYLVSAAFVRGIERSPSPQRASTGASPLEALRSDIAEGTRAIAADPVLRMLAAVEVLVASGYSIAGTSYMIFVARDLGFDTGTLGLIFATGGLGALAGAAIAPWIGERYGWRGAMAFGLALLALGGFCIPLAPAATIAGGLLLIAHQVVGDGGHVVYDVHDRTLRQTVAAPELLARVDAGIRTLGQAARLAGAVGGGILATAAGTRPALALAAALYAVAAGVVLATMPDPRR
jgi:predicted MFS family arabinose efflux permease